eukprot:7786517-Alexandrium_andersonii.AAC.1
MLLPRSRGPRRTPDARMRKVHARLRGAGSQDDERAELREGSNPSADGSAARGRPRTRLEGS